MLRCLIFTLVKIYHTKQLSSSEYIPKYTYISIIYLYYIFSLQMVTHQHRILMIMESMKFEYEVVDIAGPGMDDAKDFMRANSKKKENERHALPPQIFNGEKYCGVSF